MPELRAKWEKLGQIIGPDPNTAWMSHAVGSAFAVRVSDSSRYDVYVSGRDSQGRSQIGVCRIDLEALDKPPVVRPDPVLTFGALGAFDENGVSYPCVVRKGAVSYLFYTGWMPSVLTPFQNHLGLAIQREGRSFERASRAPILPRTDDDYLSIGSVGVVREDDRWRMWYTSFREWENHSDGARHRYVIKYADSEDGQNWSRGNITCIQTAGAGEHSICRPSVLKCGGLYHMWYCYRGEHYKIGYASSADGIAWERADERVGIEPSECGWDAIDQCYPQVFQHDRSLYMLYCGNHWGKEGIGLAKLPLQDFKKGRT